MGPFAFGELMRARAHAVSLFADLRCYTPSAIINFVAPLPRQSPVPSILLAVAIIFICNVLLNIFLQILQPAVGDSGFRLVGLWVQVGRIGI